MTLNILENYLDLNCDVIFVSHDRYFIDKITTRLLILDPIIIKSKYSSYLYNKSILHDALNEHQHTHKKPINSKIPKNLESKKDKDKKIQKKLIHKDQIEFDKIEEEIISLEDIIKDLESKLNNPQDYENIVSYN